MAATAPPQTLGKAPFRDHSSIVGMLLTVVLHVSFAGLVVYLTGASEKAMEEHIEPKMIQFEDVELLALGEEKKDKAALPRIANPAPRESRPDEINLARKKKSDKPEPKEKRKERAKKKRDDAMLDALSALHNPNRPTNDDIPEGSKEGLVGGTLTDAARASLMNTYAVKINKAIEKHWQAPTTLSDEDLKKARGKLVVYVRLSSSGQVASYRIKTRSGNSQFDDSVERAVKRFTPAFGTYKLPLPDNDEIKAIVIKRGLNLKGWGS